jgi:site-specific recombinase XerD
MLVLKQPTEQEQEEVNEENLVQEFLAMKKQQGVSNSCLNQHRYALTHLYNGKKTKPNIDDVKRCLPITMGSNYYNKRLTTFRQYEEFRTRVGQPLELNVQNIHYKKKKYHIVNHENCEVQKLLKGFNQKTFSGLRDYVLTVFILDTGTHNQSKQNKIKNINYFSEIACITLNKGV